MKLRDKLRDKLRRNAAGCLRTGEIIQAVFPADHLSLGSRWSFISKNSPRVVVVTDQRILVCQGSHLSSAILRGVLTELPRSTQLGPVTGRYCECESLGKRVYIHKRFREDVATADAFRGAGRLDPPGVSGGRDE